MSTFESIGVFVVAVGAYLLGTLFIGVIIKVDDDDIVPIAYATGVIVYGITWILIMQGVI